MFDKDITVINQIFNKEKRINEYKISYIHGFWASDDGVNINGTQLVKSDSTIVLILMSEPKYQNPKEFKRKPQGWTLKNDDYLVKGIVKDFTSITKLLEDYTDVIKITKISENDFGSKYMWNWDITGV